MLPKALTALLLVFSALSAPPQQPATFEVASVRPSDNNDGDGSWSTPGTGKFAAHNLSLQWLIMLAFGVDANQIANKPSWLATDHFEVEAKTAGNVSLSREEQKPLLQALLRERFHLATHTEVRQMPGYALTITKTGSKLQPTKGARFPNYRLAVNDHELSGLNWSMSYLAMQLQHPAGRPVIDKTGLTGGYDIDLKFAQDTPTEEVLPSVFTAVQTTLGLKLEPQNVPVEFLVIDHADRTPTAN